MRNHFLKSAALGMIAAIFLMSFSFIYAETSQPRNAKVNINTASQAELESLPRVGVKVAQRIIEFRTKNGDFKKIEEIMKVKGIGEKLFKQLRDLITVETPAK